MIRFCVCPDLVWMHDASRLPQSVAPIVDVCALEEQWCEVAEHYCDGFKCIFGDQRPARRLPLHSL